MAEILAPAGAREQLTAALRCGADAVYLGGKRFNARRNAENFEDIAEAVKLAHERGAKIYVTVNTLVLDSELELLFEEADEIAASGADAVIIQDAAVMRLFAARYPGIGRIASTQTAVHNVDGARALADQGFDTIVLARELTLSEMERIRAAVTVKLEAFIHGAHCVSLSGACRLSSVIGGRSGNRGLCAQPCRQDWRCGEKDYALSLKDMSLIPHIREMAEAGIDSFKIEGRMKRPEYVAAAVTACKKALAGEAYDGDTLRAVFSRGGFTDGYLLGRRDGTMYGYRTREDAAESSAVLGKLASLYRAEAPRVAIDMRFALAKERAELFATDGANSAKTSSGAPEAAVNRPLTEESARKSLEKTGGTPFYIRKLELDIAQGYMLPLPELNAMRRNALDAILKKRGEPVKYERRDYSPAPPEKYISRRERPALWARFYSTEQLASEDSFERILLRAERVTPGLVARYGEKLMAELPAALFPEDEDAFGAHMERLRDAGLRAVYTDNIYGVELGRRLGLAVYGGFGLNVTNTEAVRHYEALGLRGITASFELSMAKIAALGGNIPRGVAAYGRLPLMLLRNCPVRAAVGCRECGGRGKLADRLNVEFPLECAEKKYSVLLNSVPLDIADRDISGLDYALLYFTGESADEVRRITGRFLRGERAEGERTGGLYYRKLM